MARHSIAAMLITLALACSGCGGGSDKELFDTARFEEQQNNRAHALKLYREIVEKYPRSSYKALAEERLNALEQKK